MIATNLWRRLRALGDKYLDAETAEESTDIVAPVMHELKGNGNITSVVLALVIKNVGPVVFHEDQLLEVQNTALIVSKDPATGMCQAWLADPETARKRAGIPKKKDMN